MATFEFTSPEGKKFELEGPEGSTQEQAFQKFQEMRPELFSSKKEKPEKKSFVERFGETFQPVKAITEEGIVPQLGQYVKRKVTGEPAPKAEERPERPISTKESFNQVVNFAKQDPGAFVGTLANAIVADPELLFVPEFLPARIASAIEKTTKLGAAAAKTADAATQAAAMAAAQSAARQLNERGTVDMNVLRSEAQNAAAMGGAVRAVGETARYVAPGAKKYASEGTQDLLKQAREKGYTLPIGEMSPVGAIIDKYYQSPRRRINEEQFYKEVSAPTGTEVKEINAKTLPEIEKNLDSEIKGIMQNKSVFVPSAIKDTLETFLPYQKGRIETTIKDITNGQKISGDAWHEIRSELNKRAANARQSNPIMAQDIDNVLKTWDAYAQSSLPQQTIRDFNVWKQHYTAYKDIDTAIHANPTAYNNYLKGVLEPQELMTAIKNRRPAEAREPFATKKESINLKDKPVFIKFVPNKEGGQTIGNEYSIFPLTEDIFKQNKEAFVGKENLSLEDYKNLVAKPENQGVRPEYVVFKNVGGENKGLSRVGDKKSIEDYFNSRKQWWEDKSTRPQTVTSALASGLNLLGKEPVPTTLFGALPKVATGALAKPVQALGYTPPGQFALYYGAPFTGVAPKAGYALEKTVEQGNK